MIFKSIVLSFAASLLMLLGITFFTPSSANAAVPSQCKTSFLGLPVWFEYLDLNAECDIVGPTYSQTESSDQQGRINWAKASGFIAIAIVEILLRIAGLVAVGFVIYGGFRYIVSQGEPDGTKAAKETITNAMIGLVIAMVAATLINFIAGTLV